MHSESTCPSQTGTVHFSGRSRWQRNIPSFHASTAHCSVHCHPSESRPSFVHTVKLSGATGGCRSQQQGTERRRQGYRGYSGAAEPGKATKNPGQRPPSGQEIQVFARSWSHVSWTNAGHWSKCCLWLGGASRPGKLQSFAMQGGWPGGRCSALIGQNDKARPERPSKGMAQRYTQSWKAAGLERSGPCSSGNLRTQPRPPARQAQFPHCSYCRPLGIRRTRQVDSQNAFFSSLPLLVFFLSPSSPLLLSRRTFPAFVLWILDPAGGRLFPGRPTMFVMMISRVSTISTLEKRLAPWTSVCET